MLGHLKTKFAGLLRLWLRNRVYGNYLCDVVPAHISSRTLLRTLIADHLQARALAFGSRGGRRDRNPAQNPKRICERWWTIIGEHRGKGSWLVTGYPSSFGPSLLHSSVIGFVLMHPCSAALRDGTGGAAYVIFFVVAFAIITPTSSAARIALIVLAVTCALEFLQLWHPVWLEQIRRTLPGRALLGTTFSWTDFPPDFAGAGIGWTLVRLYPPPLRRC